MHLTLLKAFDITEPKTITLPLKMVTRDQFEKNPTDYSFKQIFKLPTGDAPVIWADLTPKEDKDTTAVATTTSEEIRD